MSGTKSSSRVASVKKDGSFRYATRFLALEKGKRNSSNKETNSSKSCDCVMKSDNWKSSKHSQISKMPMKKSNLKCCTTKDGRKKTNTNHREKVVIVSKRSSSVSVVKSCKLRKSVSVKKVSYSTSVVLSSDEDTDSDEESEEEDEKKEYSRKRRTVVKHTTSKVKSSIQESKKPENRAAKKAKAIKLLCDKLSASNKSKDIDSSRELRPRFPYSIMQEWPTARTHRMASLNALAKVHVVYENEGRTVGENLNDADECSLIDFLNDNSDIDDDDDDHIEVKKETKPALNASVKRNDKSKLNDVDKSKMTDGIKSKSCDGNKSKLSDGNRSKSFDGNKSKPNDCNKSKSNDCNKSKSNDCNKSKSNDGNKSKCSDKDKAKPGKKEKIQIKAKIQRRGKKRKFPDVEIIDTRICKRMASLNAQAILAASYLQEPKPKRVYRKSEKCDSTSEFDEKEVVLESKCDIKVIKTEKEDDVTFIETKQIKRNDTHSEVLRNSSKERINKNTDPTSTHRKQASENKRPETSKQKDHSDEPDLTIIEDNTSNVVSSSRKCSMANSVVTSNAATTKVGVTQYTEVRKVQINTHKDAEIKTDTKSERKIEQIISNDDVAITQMYHYQSKSTNESYCVQMQTTYKPGSRNLSPSSSRPPGDGLHPFVNEPILPGNQDYYNRNPMLPPHTYQMNPNMGPVPPAIGMDHRIPRQFGGSAFTVPHYRHPQPMQFPPNEYGYYQPAGPLIQPVQDQYTIHKPVPYHPQPNPHQPPQRPQQPSSQREGFQAFESHQSLPQKPAVPSHSSAISSQQKTNTSTGTPSSENLSQSSSSPQFTRRQPGEDSRNRSLNHANNNPSFNQPPKHVRSPVMPTLHSSQQNFRGYQTQKRVPSNFKNYNLPYDRKEEHASKHRGYDNGSSYNASHSNTSAKGVPLDSHLSRNSSTHSKEISPHVSHNASSMHSRNSSRSGEHYRNMNNPDGSKERYYGYKSGGSSSNHYHSGPSSSMHHSNMSHHGSASLNIHHPNSSSINHPNPANMNHSNSSAEMCNPGPYSNVCHSDPSSSMYGPLGHHSDSSSTFLPYHNNASKDMHHRNMPEPVGYPPRPPSVIEIIEDNHRDTKTYIQLEVPKNSHREKIVVVDVEDDDIEKKQVHPKVSDKIKPSVDKPPSKTEPEKKCSLISNIDNAKQNIEVSQNKTPVNEPAVKMEKIEKISEKNTESKNVIVENTATSSNTDTPLQEKTEKDMTEQPDVMVLEVKKKKESAVVRRARLQGKQRTFRDCYNRPLAQLSKTKKSEDVSGIAEKHLSKNFQPLVSLPRLVLPKVEKPPAHGWSFEGTPCEKQVFISNDDPPMIRRCYPSMKHVEGDIICVKDCVFLRSGPRKTDVPFVAKVTALWDNPADGEMNMSLLWYYRPEHTETGKKIQKVDDEVFASKHRDTNSVACIEDKCFVLTYAEYCRYKKRCKMLEDSSIPDFSIVPQGEEYPRKNRLPPPNVFPDLVLFCRKVYDYRQKRLLKNPV